MLHRHPRPLPCCTVWPACSRQWCQSQHGLHGTVVKGCLRNENFNVPVVVEAAAITAGGRAAPSEERRQREQQLRIQRGAKLKMKRRTTVNIQKLLTNSITAAQSLEHLHDILATHGSHLNHIHVATLLSRTAQLSGGASSHQQRNMVDLISPPSQQMQPIQQQWQQQPPDVLQAAAQQQLLCSTLTAMMVQRLRHATAKSVVSAVAALGRLSAVVDHQTGNSVSSLTADQLQQLADRAQQLQSELGSNQLAIVFWGLAKAGYKPSSSWLKPMLQCFLQQYHLQYHHHNHQQQQHKRWLHPLHQHSLATDLSMVLYSLAVSGVQPSKEWLGQWQEAFMQQLAVAKAQDLSQTLWSMASLGCKPNEAWLSAVLHTLESSMPTASVQGLSNAIWAVAQFNRIPSDTWLDSFMEALLADQQLAANPQAVCICLTSLARLQMPVQRSWIHTLLERSTQHLECYNSRHLTSISWACARMNSTPSPAWLKTYLTVTARQAAAGRFTAHQIASVIWSLAVIKQSGDSLLTSQQLQVQVLLQAIAAANCQQGLKQLDSSARSGLIWALAALQVVPSRHWLSIFFAAAFEGGLAQDPVLCATVLFCAASLDFDYLVEWLEGFLAEQGSSTEGLDLSLEKYAALVEVLTALGEMDSKQLRAAWLDLSDSGWSVAAAAAGPSTFATQLPPSFSTRVDSMLTATTAGPNKA